MKICHICLSNFFIDGRLYQENELVKQHLADGHDVSVIASTEMHDDGGRVVYVEPSRYVGDEGAMVTRLSYWRYLPHWLARRLRVHAGVYELLDDFKPDAVLFHGSAGWEMLTVARYVRAHPNCVFHIDSHTDANNSARNWLSAKVLHRQIYRRILQRALPAAGRLLCISVEAKNFAKSVYDIPESRLEFFPLGGHPIPDAEFFSMRDVTRDRLGVTEDQILLLQSGKQTSRKMLTESLEAFSRVKSPRLRFAIVGVLDESIRTRVEALISADSRVLFLGWQNGRALTELLCATDIYLQPGTQSVTMQHSMCCRCAVILADVPSHEVYKQSNGWFIKDTDDLLLAFEDSLSADLSKMGRNSYHFACSKLDYRVLAPRVLSMH